MEWNDESAIDWTKVTGICRLWDGSCNDKVCCAGITISFLLYGTKNADQCKVPTLWMPNSLVVPSSLKVSKFGCRDVVSRIEVVKILVQLQFDFVAVQCILCLNSRIPCHVFVYSMQFSLDLQSIGADCDQAPPCLAQRVSCGSGRFGQCLSREEAHLWEQRAERFVCPWLLGTSQPIFFKLQKGLNYIGVHEACKAFLKGSSWEFVHPSPDVVVQVRVTVQYWNIGGNYGPFGAFFFSLQKLDRRREDSSDMVTLRKKNMLWYWMSNAAKDGSWTDWACVTPASMFVTVQHLYEDLDGDLAPSELRASWKFGQHGRGGTILS